MTCLHGVDLLSELQRGAAQEKATTMDEDCPLNDFWNEITKPPPPGIAATQQEIERAHAFFATHALPINLSLLQFSLAGGFARYEPYIWLDR